MIKEEQRPSQERSVMSQNGAFITSRKYINNAEQKHIAKERKSSGSEDFRRERGGGQIAHATAGIAGINMDEIRGHGKGCGGERVVGQGGSNRTPQTHQPQNDQETAEPGGSDTCEMRPVFRSPSPPSRKKHPKNDTSIGDQI